MLTRFEVENFKGFNERFIFDLDKAKSFEFNQDCTKGSIVAKGLIYGKNGIGKSNLGHALFDLISHTTDNKTASELYQSYYLNADHGGLIAQFKFVFNFNGNQVTYEYGKFSYNQIAYEHLSVNGRVVASLDRQTSKNAYINLPGAESLKTNLGESNVSLIAYIKNNALIDIIDAGKAFVDFVNFLKGMLYFRSVNYNMYQGIDIGSDTLEKRIINSSKLMEFQQLLNAAGVHCSLEAMEINGQQTIGMRHRHNLIPFNKVASSGSRSLMLVYYWMLVLYERPEATFVFIDEFDAYYHFELSKLILSHIKRLPQQVLLTTHNTQLMSNEVMRPDCCFEMQAGRIDPLMNKTSKELRQAHNIEKMYRAGSFNV
ncbi:AAA family ATPase [uncultured Pseudoteredinibacter sp.]|uniref:AAA family ATPase n=1 Tax=uncultured Pseudoteredinibacter sp. TaxID=1641701 RepID=UPI00260AEE6F|nr:AAA family ATPase [uncultured Pseudoteredinibacter sp.]